MKGHWAGCPWRSARATSWFVAVGAGRVWELGLAGSSLGAGSAACSEAFRAGSLSRGTARIGGARMAWEG